MAANRKLQGEIDRTLKKVQEGVEIFDEIWEKVYNAQNQNQKEKFESELKSQIKKLQRYRDDIKTWITNSDIKDKRPLTDARKLIETEMERFKVCEKEFKTKAFSKEGLSQQPKEDPKEKEKNKVRKWIAEKLETLASQTDAYEVEIENSTSSKGKKNKKNDSVLKYETLIERVHYHEEKLEVVLRLLENETLSAEDIEPIQEQLDYLLEQMVDGNTDEVEMIDDETIYEDLGLEDQAGDEQPQEEAKEEKKPSKEEKKGRKGGGDDDDKKEKKKEKPAPAQEIALPTLNAAAKATPLPKPGKEPAKPAAKQPATASPLPTVSGRGGKAAASVTLAAPQAARSGRAAAAPPAAAPAEPAAQLFARVAQRPSKEEPPAVSSGKGCGGLPAASAQPPQPQPAQPPAGLPTTTAAARLGDSLGEGSGRDSGESIFSAGGGAAGPEGGAIAASRGSGSAPGSGSTAAAAATRGPPADMSLTAEEAAPLEALGSAGATFLDEALDEAQQLQMLHLSLQNLPEAGDSERPKTYVPRNPYPTPSSFPQAPAAVFDSPSAFDKFDTDTLFFIFYYQQGTYQQYLAARELKKQSWRYHKKYLTWFQRHEEPKLTADDYEQGTYVYFDYETGWCQRIKSEFTFEYGYLEDELPS